MALNIDQLAATLRSRSFDAVFRWVVVFGLICLGAVVLWDYGFLRYTYESDSSRISLLIAVLFLAYSGYCLYVLLVIAREMRFAGDFSAQAEEALDKLIREGTKHDLFDKKHGDSGMVATFFNDLTRKLGHDPEGDRDLLLQSLAGEFRHRTRTGAYAADLLYKLGMLGTVIGFVIMLNSMGNLGNFDVDTLRGALQQMTGGMAVALLTTIAGLVCGILLRIQFNIAEDAASQVVQSVVRFTDVTFVPLLKRSRRDV